MVQKRTANENRLRRATFDLAPDKRDLHIDSFVIYWGHPPGGVRVAGTAAEQTGTRTRR